MQDAGYKTGLIALAAMFVAGIARADSGDLPLAQIDSYLQAAGANTAWSIAQYRSGTSWEIDAFSNRRDLGKNLCATEFRSFEVRQQVGGMDVKYQKPGMRYALSQCMYADPESFHAIRGKFDAARLEDDFATIRAAMQGKPPTDVRLVVEDPKFRAVIAQFAPEDIDEIEINPDGHLRLVLFTRMVDILGAPILLSAEVVPGAPTEVKVAEAGVIDIMPVQSGR